MKSVRKNFFGSIISLLVILAIAYFTGAAGLYNSIDTPQYFTTKSLIESNSVDISRYSSDPHYFVFPDVFYGDDGKTFGVRGYLISVAAIPLYLISRSEVGLTGLFGIFTALGIGYMSAAMILLGVNRRVAWCMGIIVGFGTYAWKYANTLNRQGIMVLFLGMSLYLLAKRNTGKNGGYLVAIWALSYGVDLSLFVGLSVCLVVWLTYTKLIRRWKVLSGIFLLIISGQVILNMHWYGQLSSFGTTRQPTVMKAVGERTLGVWFSSPLIPAVRSVLFNYGRLGEDVFTNFSYLPKEVGEFSSVEYAKKYIFMGIFAVSPFLLFGWLSIFKFKTYTQRQKLVLICVFVLFACGVGINAKVLNFWGGNQYDVRYFYPFAICLMFATGLVIDRLIKGRKWGLLMIFGMLVSYSLLAGWWGQMSMYKPNLTGERKIWMDAPIEIFSSGQGIKFLLQNTFTNL